MPDIFVIEMLLGHVRKETILNVTAIQGSNFEKIDSLLFAV